MPLADGGEGTEESLVHATNGSDVSKEVTGSLGSKVEDIYGILGDKRTAVIEVAAAWGLPLVPLNHRNPFFYNNLWCRRAYLGRYGKRMP
jgi:glycerate kinase